MRDVPELSVDTVFRLGFAVELSLVGLAAGIGFTVHGEPFPFLFRFDLTSLWHSFAATAPMLVMAFVATSGVGLRVPPLRRIYEAIRRILGKPIRDMDLLQIVLLSLAAGIGEETLFRGILQQSWGIIATSVVFGLLHAVTVTYFVLAFGISLYFGWWMQLAENNIVAPIAAHAFYDALALFLLRRRFRSEGLEDDDSDAPGDDDAAEAPPAEEEDEADTAPRGDA